MLVTVSPRMVSVVFRHAEEAYPAEACGFLVGEWSGENAQVDEATPAQNAGVYSSQAFEIDAQHYMNVVESLRGTGRQIVGFYHSHPGQPDVPSQEDWGSAQNWPDMLWMIVRVEAGQALSQQTYFLPQGKQAFEKAEVHLS